MYAKSIVAVCLTLASAACVEPEVGERSQSVTGLENQVRALAASHGVVVPNPPSPPPALVELGRALAFDKELSGDRDISCMTCHHPTLGLGDQRSLSIGQGATGLGPARVHPNDEFIPRNAPSMFNLSLLDVMFWDGRVSVTSTGFDTPAGPLLTPAMANVMTMGAAAAQAMFPVTSRAEMRGFTTNPNNELAAVADDDLTGIWAAIMTRLSAIPAYVTLFEQAYPSTPMTQMTFAHAANAIAAFEIAELSFDQSPFDRFLAGESTLTNKQLLGARWFFTKGGCVACHNGPALSDQQHHNTGRRQLGPGKGNGPDGDDDFGRENVSSDPADRYAFRTPPLRNVTVTGPWGHAGQFVTLDSMVAHYRDASSSLYDYDGSQLEPLLQPTVLDNAAAIEATLDPLVDDVLLNPAKLAQVLDFLASLTDPAAQDLSSIIPATVPSGLPVAD